MANFHLELPSGAWPRWQIFLKNDKIFLFENKKNGNSIEIFLRGSSSQIIWQLDGGQAAKLHGRRCC